MHGYQGGIADIFIRLHLQCTAKKTPQFKSKWSLKRTFSKYFSIVRVTPKNSTFIQIDKFSILKLAHRPLYKSTDKKCILLAWKWVEAKEKKTPGYMQVLWHNFLFRIIISISCDLEPCVQVPESWILLTILIDYYFFTEIEFLFSGTSSCMAWNLAKKIIWQL